MECAGLGSIHAHATLFIAAEQRRVHTNAFAEESLELVNRWWWVYLERVCVAEGLRWPRWDWPVAARRRIAAVGNYWDATNDWPRWRR